MKATYLLLNTPRTGAEQQEFMKHLEHDLGRRHERAVARRVVRSRALASVQQWRPWSLRRLPPVVRRQPAA